MPLLNLWLGGESMRVELQQVARGVSDLAKDASDEKRSSSRSHLVVAVQAQMFTGNQMRQDIEMWLCPADPFINFNTANDAHYEGTSEWILQSSAFKSWKESGSLLWIHGKRISFSLSARPPLLTELRVHSGIWEVCP